MHIRNVYIPPASSCPTGYQAPVNHLDRGLSDCTLIHRRPERTQQLMALRARQQGQKHSQLAGNLRHGGSQRGHPHQSHYQLLHCAPCQPSHGQPPRLHHLESQPRSELGSLAHPHHLAGQHHKAQSSTSNFHQFPKS